MLHLFPWGHHSQYALQLEVMEPLKVVYFPVLNNKDFKEVFSYSFWLLYSSSTREYVITFWLQN